MEGNFVQVLLFIQTLLFYIQTGLTEASFWCPVGRYPAPNGRCGLCYEYCGELGCTGSKATLGPGGCNSCWLGLQTKHSTIKCMSPFQDCPKGYYRRQKKVKGHLLSVCKPCHPLCKTCSGPGISYCDTCKYTRENGLCANKCQGGIIILKHCLTIGHRLGNRRPGYFVSYRDRTHHRSRKHL